MQIRRRVNRHRIWIKTLTFTPQLSETKYFSLGTFISPFFSIKQSQLDSRQFFNHFLCNNRYGWRQYCNILYLNYRYCNRSWRWGLCHSVSGLLTKTRNGFWSILCHGFVHVLNLVFLDMQLLRKSQSNVNFWSNCITAHCMFGCQSIYIWPSHFPLRLSDDRQVIVLHDDSL